MDYEIKIYQLDKLDQKQNFLKKLIIICNRDIKFPLQNNSLNNKIKNILGDEIIDVVSSDKSSVNLMSIGKDGNLYIYKDNVKGTVVKVEDKYYQKISDKRNNWKYVKSSLKITEDIKKTEENKDLKFETLNLISQFNTKNTGGKDINSTFIALLFDKNKNNEILAFIIFSNNDNNIFIDATCGKNRNGEFLLNNMFDYFKEKNFNTIKLTALPLVYETWKTKYNFRFKDDDASNVSKNDIERFLENNFKFFLKSGLSCNENTENTFKNPLANNLSEIYSDNGIPMELNLNTLKNLDSNLKIPVEIPSTQNNYFKITGQYSNSKLSEFLNSKAAAPSSVSPSASPSALPPAPPAPSPSASPASSPSSAPQPSASPSVSPSAPPSVSSQSKSSASPSVSPLAAPPSVSPSSVSPSSAPQPAPAPSQASSQSKSSAPPASVILPPRPKMEKKELDAIISKLEANEILINYGNILKYRDVNLSTSSETNNICLWTCQRQTRSLDSKNNEGKKLYSKCEFKNRHLVLDTNFYKQVCEKKGKINNYDSIINHNTENFTLCHNHIKQFLGVKMIFSGKKTGNEVQIKNLWERPTNSVICYYKNPLFINETFHKDLGNFIKKSNDRSLKNCYFEIKKDANGKELSHFKVKALKDIQKGEILYF
jgi:hypothetical protein